jgi:hypothetical protein
MRTVQGRCRHRRVSQLHYQLPKLVLIRILLCSLMRLAFASFGLMNTISMHEVIPLPEQIRRRVVARAEQLRHAQASPPIFQLFQPRHLNLQRRSEEAVLWCGSESTRRCNIHSRERNSRLASRGSRLTRCLLTSGRSKLGRTRSLLPPWPIVPTP